MSALENYLLSALRAVELLSKRTVLSPRSAPAERYDPIAKFRAAAQEAFKRGARHD